MVAEYHHTTVASYGVKCDQISIFVQLDLKLIRCRMSTTFRITNVESLRREHLRELLTETYPAPLLRCVSVSARLRAAGFTSAKLGVA